MMFAMPTEKYSVDAEQARALEVIFILHLDHEQNASTSTVRTAGSSQANPMGACAGGRERAGCDGKRAVRGFTARAGSSRCTGRCQRAAKPASCVDHHHRWHSPALPPCLPAACVASGIAALWGPAHGGANEAVLRQLEEIQAVGGVGAIPAMLARAKDKADPFRLMGFGHRVYKT